MKRSAIFLLLALAATLMFASAASAALVEVQWSEPDPAQFAANKAQAVEKGKVKAVIEAAVAMLPENVDEARRTLLEQELTESANHFVQTYAEVSLSQTQDGWVLFLDVAVNDQALRDWLGTQGVFQTASAPLPYDLLLMGADDTVWQEIGRLQALTGVTPQAGAMPRLTLELLGTIWNGHMETGGGLYSEQSDDLATLWNALWGQYFAANPRSSGASVQVSGGGDGSTGAGTGGAALSGSGDVLQVSGWYSADGVYAFDQELGQWTGEVAGAVLLDVTMRSTGLTARWRLGTVNRQALESRMQTYTAGRNLQYSLQSR